jgi:DNA replication factor GINS
LPETILEYLKRHLELEEQSEKLIRLPEEFYTRVASYARNLRRASGSGNSEITNRLISKQFQLIEGMVERLATLRTSKALAAGSVSLLLPEERYVCFEGGIFGRRLDAFVEAVSSGQSSFLELANRREVSRNNTVRFLKPVTEIIGLDLRRYGPFKADDLASVPAANAEILVANGEAVIVYSRELA